jgi:hypothetical protein
LSFSFSRRHNTIRHRQRAPNTEELEQLIRQQAADAKLGCIAPKLEGRIVMVKH